MALWLLMFASTGVDPVRENRPLTVAQQVRVIGYVASAYLRAYPPCGHPDGPAPDWHQIDRLLREVTDSAAPAIDAYVSTSRNARRYRLEAALNSALSFDAKRAILRRAVIVDDDSDPLFSWYALQALIQYGTHEDTLLIAGLARRQDMSVLLLDVVHAISRLGNRPLDLLLFDEFAAQVAERGDLDLTELRKALERRCDDGVN